MEMMPFLKNKMFLTNRQPRIVFIGEIIVILLLSFLTFLFSSHYLTATNTNQLGERAESFVAQFVDIPLDAQQAYGSDAYPGTVFSRKWTQDAAPLVLALRANSYDSKTRSYVYSLSLNAHTGGGGRDALLQVIIDSRMLDLLKKTPNGFQRTNVHDADGLRSLIVNTLGSAGIFWHFDENLLNDQFNVRTAAAVYDLQQGFDKLSRFIPLFEFWPFVALPIAFLAGLSAPYVGLFFLVYYLLPAVGIVIAMSILKPSFRSLRRLNLFLLLSLFITTPILTFIWLYFIDIYH